MSGVSIRAVVLSRFALDGGAMHGIVPRVLWQRTHKPDDKHRIPLVARSLVVDHAPSGARVLLDTGMGQAWSDLERSRYALASGPEAPEALVAAGIDPDTITHVVLTHLHWDHAGGVVRAGGGLAFPRAEHVIGEACLAHAARPEEKDAGSFRVQDIELLLREGRVRRWKEGDPLAPGLTGRVSNGHTEGLIVPMIPARDDGGPLAFPTDLVPTRSHLQPNWVMAYDNHPTESIREKRALYADLFAQAGSALILYHDPLAEAAHLEDGELVAGPLPTSRPPSPQSGPLA